MTDVRDGAGTLSGVSIQPAPDLSDHQSLVHELAALAVLRAVPGPFGALSAGRQFAACRARLDVLPGGMLAIALSLMKRDPALGLDDALATAVDVTLDPPEVSELA